MELRLYLKFIRRRWPVIVVPLLVVLASLAFTYRPPGTFYNVGVRFIVGQTPTAAADLEDEERLATWQTSEYVVAALADWVEGTRFAERISDRLAQQGLDVPYAAIWKGGSGIVADYSRSQLTLSLTHGDRDELAAMMAAAIAVLQTDNAEGVPQLGGESAEIVQLDDPIINAVSPPIFDQLDVVVRLALALAAGFGIALVLEYLDRTVHERSEVEALDIAVLGEIPRPRPRLSRLWRSGAQE